MRLLFDVGGTHTRIGISKDGQTLDQHQIFNTPDSFEKCLDLMFKKSAEMSSEKAEIVIIGIAGTLDPERSKLVYSHNLKDWVGKPLKKILEEKFGNQVYLENDAILGGLGEANLGAGKNYKIVGYLTFGTGIGGAKIINGQVDSIKYGFEPGALIVDFDKNLELEVGLFRGQNLEQSELDYLVATTVHNCTVLWSPEVIILGGGVIHNIDLEKVKEIASKSLKVFPEIPKIKITELGDFVGLYGAIQYSNNLP